MEFGVPMNFQHRMTFSCHKPVYNVGGYLFSIHQITYGILKASQPLPSLFSKHTASASQSYPGAGAGVSIVNVTTHATKAADPSADLGKMKDLHLTVAADEMPASKSPILTVHHAIETKANATPSVNSVTFGNAKIPLRFVPTDPRYRFRVQKSSPFVVFALADGARNGPRFNVYRSEKITLQLQVEAAEYLNRNVDTAKMTTADSSGFSGLVAGLGKRRTLHIPQLLVWYARDFFPSLDTVSNEQLVSQLYQLVPKSTLGKAVKENLARQESDRAIIKVRDHSWELELYFPLEHEERGLHQ